MAIQLKRLPHGTDLPLPSYATPGAAGMDICSAQSLTLLPERATIVKTGFEIAVPSGYEVQVRSRSGLAAKHSIHVLNSPGTIDEDYRGEIFVILQNSGRASYYIEKGDRIAQLVLSPVSRTSVTEVEELQPTARGSSGLGSTGR